jgi:hypothetical protein
MCFFNQDCVARDAHMRMWARRCIFKSCDMCGSIISTQACMQASATIQLINASFELQQDVQKCVCICVSCGTHTKSLSCACSELTHGFDSHTKLRERLYTLYESGLLKAIA